MRLAPPGLLLTAVTLLLAPQAALAATSAADKPVVRDDDDDEENTAPVTEVVVTARRLDVARAGVEPDLGAAAYAVSNDVVEGRPGGEAASLTHVLLQMPGVSQSGSGELRVRGQGGLQYRINNVILPEGFSDPADTLRARFADDVRLLRGALPAQYGLQTGGIVDITTKNGVYLRGGEFEAYAGSYGRLEMAFEAAGSRGDLNYYASGSLVRDKVGRLSLDGAGQPLNDDGREGDAFVFLDRILDPQSRVSLIAGVSSDQNQLPTLAKPALSSLSASPGAAGRIDLGGSQRSRAAYAIASYQYAAGKLTYQASLSVRYATIRLIPDAADTSATDSWGAALSSHDTGAGLQFESAYDASPSQTLRAGLIVSIGRDSSRSLYRLPSGGPLPTLIAGRSSDERSAASLYLQDEWRPTDALTVNAGLRFDQATGPGGGRQGGLRLNAVWNPGGSTILHAGYARYVSPAPPDEDAAWPIVVGGSPARAERDDYFDVGLEQVLGDLKLSLGGYWREAANLLDAARAGSTTLQRPFNYAEGRVGGVEFDTVYAEGPFSAWLNLALSRSEGRRIVAGQTGLTPAQVAATAGRFLPTNDDQRVTASFGAAYRLGDLRLSADALYGSGLPRTAPGGPPNGARLSDHLQANLSAVYRLEGLRDRPLSLRLDITNLFDERYALQDGSSLAGGLPQWGARRGVFVGLEQQF